MTLWKIEDVSLAHANLSADIVSVAFFLTLKHSIRLRICIFCWVHVFLFHSLDFMFLLLFIVVSLVRFLFVFLLLLLSLLLLLLFLLLLLLYCYGCCRCHFVSFLLCKCCYFAPGVLAGIAYIQATCKQNLLKHRKKRQANLHIWKCAQLSSSSFYMRAHHITFYS